MTLSHLLDRISDLTVVVVGDLMLDEYIHGAATRISPEAPVMVLLRERDRAVPGGAANVALNASVLGAKVRVVGLVGEDPAGDKLRTALLEGSGIEPFLVPDSSRPTTRKTRIIAGSTHQVMRIDHEVTSAPSSEVENLLIGALREAAQGAQAILFSDYVKGVLTPNVIAAALELGLFTSVNAKPESAPRYQGVDLMSLNRVEIRGLMKEDPKSLSEAEALASKALSQHGMKAVLATMGDQGLAAAWSGGGCQIPAPKVEVSDVAGAGDTVIACASLGCSAVGYHPTVFRLAVEASSRVVRHAGVVAPSQAELEEIRALGS